jgi:ectoine hydroxylase-related dioxygenase (phytanoyl-CoA dioxygenase family)
MQALLKQSAEELVADFERDGYYAPIPVISAAEASALRRKLEAFEAGHGKPLKPEYRQKAHLIFTWLADLVRHPAILDNVERVLGPDILVWSSSFFIKEARDPGFVSWHQDSTYWGLSEPEVLTAWVAFTPSNPANGCVRVIPGTHKMDQVPHKETFDAKNLLTRGQEVAVEVDESKAVELVLKPGEMSMHHIRLFHNSEPNNSDDRRIGFAIRYIPTRIKQTASNLDSATLARGTDRYGHFELEPRPASDFAPEAVAYHKEVKRRQTELLYRGTKGK